MDSHRDWVAGAGAQYQVGAGRGGGGQGKRRGLPFLEPQTLPGSEGLGGVFQHPEFVEKHHVKDDQQHQTRKRQRGQQQQA